MIIHNLQLHMKARSASDFALVSAGVSPQVSILESIQAKASGTAMAHISTRDTLSSALV